MRYASRAPARSAASFTARRSTLVTPEGTQIISSGWNTRIRPLTLLMKYSSIFSVMT